MGSVPPPPRSAASAALNRLVIAGAAGLVSFALGWAGMEVRERQLEARRLRARVAALEIAARTQPVPAAVPRPEPVPGGAQGTAREQELQSIIDFLRQENAAAQQIIERLSGVAPPAESERKAIPVVPDPPVPAGRPAGRP